MRLALAQARSALRAGEVPVGAVLVAGGTVVARGFNQPIRKKDPTAHAEAIALRRAGRAVGNYRLAGTVLYVTVEPCLMCVGAVVNARVSTLVYGAAEPKFGAVSSILTLDTLHLTHRMTVIRGILEAECRKLLVDFFRSRRERS